MMNERPHKKLVAWQKAVELVEEIYRITDGFPKKEEFGIIAQLRRAAISVPSNIAEGLTRRTKKDKLHFLNIAQASLSEIDTQIEISMRLVYISKQVYENAKSGLSRLKSYRAGLHGVSFDVREQDSMVDSVPELINRLFTIHFSLFTNRFLALPSIVCS
jgi:four helix bundle protein